MKLYSELILLEDYDSRLDYLQLLDNNVLSPRHMSMPFYKSRTWRHVRQMILDRDLGFDMGLFGLYIDGDKQVHHINPITEWDIIHHSIKLLDPENLITVSTSTHNKIHYGEQKQDYWVERTPGDTILW